MGGVGGGFWFFVDFGVYVFDVYGGEFELVGCVGGGGCDIC